uniref:Uncharacterized protein n=1 Tax=Anguilla anguilla TaxID=7936 RepID=A0A0E9QYE5_ANGAN
MVEIKKQKSQTKKEGAWESW